MKLKLLLSTLSLFYACISYAGYSYKVKSSKQTIFGPYIMKGDFYHLKILIKDATEELKSSCSGEDRRLLNKLKIEDIEIKGNTMRSIKIRITDRCYVI